MNGGLSVPYLYTNLSLCLIPKLSVGTDFKVYYSGESKAVGTAI